MPTRRRRRRAQRELPPLAKVIFGISPPADLVGAQGGFADEQEAAEAWAAHRADIITHENRWEGRPLFVPPPFWFYDAANIDAQRKRVRDDFFQGGYRDVESDAALAARFGLHTPGDLIKYRRRQAAPAKRSRPAVLKFPAG